MKEKYEKEKRSMDKELARFWLLRNKGVTDILTCFLLTRDVLNLKFIKKILKENLHLYENKANSDYTTLHKLCLVYKCNICCFGQVSTMCLLIPTGQKSHYLFFQT